MKTILYKLIFTVLAVLLTAEVMAQVPQGFNFQAVARDANGEILADQDLGLQVTILEGSETGTAVYTETQTPNTNASGSFQIVIGEGTTEDDFGAIDWSSDNYYVKLEIDPAGGTSYEELGTTRLLSVPYALLAQDVVNGGSGGSEISLPFDLAGPNGNRSVMLSSEGENGEDGTFRLSNAEGYSRVTMYANGYGTDSETYGGAGGVWFGGNNGNTNVLLGGFPPNPDYGNIELGDPNGTTLARMHTRSLNDTSSAGRLVIEDTFGKRSGMIPGEFTTGHKDGGLRAHLIGSRLQFNNWDIQTPAPPAQFGTYQGDGFIQLVDFTETGVLEGAILTGFWQGHPTILMEDENETGLAVLEVQKRENKNIGSLTLRGTDDKQLTIDADGITSNSGITTVFGNLHVDGDITHTGSISQTSDRNLKENIQPLQNGLGTIMQLNPSTYNFRGNGEYNGLKLSTGLKYGLIAQEVEEVLPSLVKNNIHTYSEATSSGSGPDVTAENEVKKIMEYKTMNYTELVPVLIKAVQEQQVLIEGQQQKIQKLLDEVEALKKKK
ncbi:MAG: tail fiber domain-containing protein [Gracilimonas sp.]